MQARRKRGVIPKKTQSRRCANPQCDFHHIRPNGRDAPLVAAQKEIIPEQHANETLRTCGYCDAVWIVGMPAPGKLIGFFDWKDGERIFRRA